MQIRRAAKWELFAPAMVVLEPLRRRSLRQALMLLDEMYRLRGKRVLDVGAGTGTLVAELVHFDCTPVAVEPSRFMSRILRARFPQVPVHEELADTLISVADESVDISLVAATLHGFQPEYRQRVYKELKRVTRDAVAIIDYHANNHRLVAAAEWLEGGDYFRFVEVVDQELEEAFARVDKRRIRSFESLYLAWIRPDGGEH